MQTSTQSTTWSPNAWTLAIAGVAAILFGLAAMLWPGITLVVLVVLFGIYAIIDGAVNLVGFFRDIGAHRSWWVHLVIGIIGIIAGLLVLFYPGISAVVLAVVIGIWAIIVGIAEIVGAFTTGQFLLAVTGVISVVFGLILFANPLVGAISLVWVIGIFAIIRGIILLVQAIRIPSTAQPA